MHKEEVAKKRTTMALDKEDWANIDLIRQYLEKQAIKVSAAEAIRYALRQTVAALKRSK